MRNVWLVMRHEFLSTVGQRSFWISTFLLPIVIIALSVLAQFLGASSIEDGMEGLAPKPPERPLGYVDRAGIIDHVPTPLPPDLFVSFADETDAHAALEEGTIDGYFVIAADYIGSGALTFVGASYNPFNSLVGSDLFNYVIVANLIDEDAYAGLLINPIVATDNTVLAPSGGRDSNNLLAFLAPLASVMIFSITLLTSSGFMLQSVTKEKENRVIEILLVSLPPRQLLMGKVLGLGGVALLQLLFWLGSGMLALNQLSAILAAAAAFALPPGFVLWALIYFLLGYLLYSALLGGVGALVPDARQGAQYTFVAMLPLIVPLWLNSIFINAPHGGVATALSLFPLTAPVAMMARLTAGGVPFWQLAVTAVLLALTTYAVILLSARLFRAQTLLSGTPLTLRRLWSALLQKA